MKKVKAWVGIGFMDNKEEILEFDDNATEDEINTEIMIWADNHIEVGWIVLE